MKTHIELKNALKKIGYGKITSYESYGSTGSFAYVYFPSLAHRRAVEKILLRKGFIVSPDYSYASQIGEVRVSKPELKKELGKEFNEEGTVFCEKA